MSGLMDVVYNLAQTVALWPKTNKDPTPGPVKLHVFDKPASSPYLSYYCQKTETYLRATGTQYNLASAMPHSAPRSQLPYVTLPSGEDLSDSQLIIKRLSADNSRDCNLDKHLKPAQLAQSRAIIADVDQCIFPTLVWHRASEPANWDELYKEVFVAQLPWGLRDLAAAYQKRVYRTTAWYNGIGRHTPEEIRDILREWVEGIAELLKSHKDHPQRYIMGLAEPTLADVAIYALLVSALGTLSNGFVQEEILTRDVLRGYVKHLTERWFPEYEEVLCIVATV
ncbi:hypothetical protein CALCODRAFT_504858 [Calocera cornea HHB12733]|uniref:Thioredoxin-like fold domain-containing protein n=1 Tax=Calocera cornea HHB12733 TaxID=1353952 RepID=A0A165C6E5_9BASI|nr:hypothetical protein CALCODRAFT_504858 [Calocera cornea HHB12733]